MSDLSGLWGSDLVRSGLGLTEGLGLTHSSLATSSADRKEALRRVNTGDALQTGGEALQEGGALRYLSLATLLIFTVGARGSFRESVSDSPSHPIAGISYSGSSYTGLLGVSETLEAELVGGGASSDSCFLTGGAGGGTLGRVRVLVRRLRLGFLRLSMMARQDHLDDGPPARLTQQYTEGASPCIVL
ncbi:hypothetical protein EYF80_011913 [Liparis tanakae]|uniref:Uncharacterized protein n=1 Tax=Liparis tanakae TaxID=230148 RepID=A0A4Z2IIX4_9TELE|nr:hypothetical protein EYF80_011913 [Liparis tanakae]